MILFTPNMEKWQRQIWRKTTRVNDGMQANSIELYIYVIIITGIDNRGHKLCPGKIWA